MASPPLDRKVVVVTFGGGARDEETFAPEGQENIPHLLGELIPQATFFTQVINRGILGHYVATASLATGVYETFNNYAAVSPAHPTIFEYYRKQRVRPAQDAWVVAPSGGFHGIGESSHGAFGHGYGAGVILPKRLLAGSAQPHDVADIFHLLHDNYEAPVYTPQTGATESDMLLLSDVLKLSMSDFRAHAATLASPDELSVYVARQLMRRVAPSLLWITLHDIDIAHSGAYSLYVEGIRRTDRLCAEIWQAVQSDPEYKDKTTMFVLPDFGRDGDAGAGGNGFQHHRTGDALSRTTWMMVLGPGVRQNRVVDRPVESVDLVPTVGSKLRVDAQLAAGRPLMEVL